LVRLELDMPLHICLRAYAYMSLHMPMPFWSVRSPCWLCTSQFRTGSGVLCRDLLGVVQSSSEILYSSFYLLWYN